MTISAEASTSREALDTTSVIFKRLHPATYLARFLAASLREDGRGFSHFRPTSVVLGGVSSSADGSCLVTLGGTTVVACVKAEIGVPGDEEHSGESRGWIVPNVELPPLSSSKFKPGPPSEEAQIVSNRLLNILESSACISLESLLIEKAKAAWCVYLDITCIAYDGNVLDAACLAAVGALRDTRLPQATYDADLEAAVYSTATDQDRIPLEFHNIALSSSFGIYESQHILADPTAFETSHLDAQLTVAISLDENDRSAPPEVSWLHGAGRIRAIHQRSGATLQDSEVLDLCSQIASDRAQTLRNLLDEAVNTREVARNTKS